MDTPFISCIVPVYNVESYITRCIDSVLLQTFSDFELILVDDGSPDNCGRICDNYAKKDNRIVVIHKKNEGVSSARNAGLDISRGKWICFLDSDDWLDINYFSIIDKYIKQSESDLLIFGLKVENENHFFSDTFLLNSNEEFLINNKSDFHKFFFSLRVNQENDACLNSLLNKVFKGELIQNIRFDNEIKLGEDLIFCLDYFKKVNHSIVLKKCFYWYRCNATGAIHTFRESDFNDTNRVLAKTAEYFNYSSEDTLSEELLTQYKYTIVMNCLIQTGNYIVNYKNYKKQLLTRFTPLLPSLKIYPLLSFKQKVVYTIMRLHWYKLFLIIMKVKNIRNR